MTSVTFDTENARFTRALDFTLQLVVYVVPFLFTDFANVGQAFYWSMIWVLVAMTWTEI